MMIVSACLAGFPCRYDGKARPCAQVVELVRAGKAIPVCPEQLGGLPTPRTSCEIREGRVVDADGRDRTEAFQRGAKAVLRIAQTYVATEALLQSRSPSCGSGWIYVGSFTKTLTAGDGVTARLLKENGIQVTAL
ncbi:MAG: DUF523 domain-containing protein [Clostridia bacterium]|nr:DUF523 domain-containing protein [Clostridia bacterium]